MDDKKILDRSNKKWTQLLLPEHRMELYKLDLAQQDVVPPKHEEDRLTELAEILSRALIDALPVKVTYWAAKRNRIETGYVKRIDPIRKAIEFQFHGEHNVWIEAKCLVNVEILD